MTTTLEPRFEQGRIIHIAGISCDYRGDTSADGIPQQWEEFAPHIGNIKGQVSNATYGVCWDFGDGSSAYLCGVETEKQSDVPVGMTSVSLGPWTYAVFTHEGPVSTIRATWSEIYDDWFPNSEKKPDGNLAYERYSDDFDPATGQGTIEIWIPVTD